MKITQVICQILRIDNVEAKTASSQDSVLVRVRTDNGLEGIGEADSSPEMVKAVIDAPFSHNIASGLRELLIGENPLETERLWQKMYRQTMYAGRRSVTITAMAAVDMALWDILGKSLNAPVYQLLGGACRPKVRAYANGWYSKAKNIDDYGKLARDASSFGFKHIKIDPFWPSDLYGEPEEIARPKDIIHNVREAVGPGTHILVEGHGRFNADRAIQIARALEEYNPYFFEDPVPPENVDVLARVTNSI